MRELRCPVGPKRQFAQLNLEEAVLQVSCQDCRKLARRLHPDLVHVLHSFSIFSGLIESTAWQWPSGLTSPEGQVPLRLFRGDQS